MFNILFWNSKYRIIVGVVVGLFVAFNLPNLPSLRLWIGTLFGLLCPFLVLGRRQALNPRVFSILQSGFPRPRRLQIQSLTPALFIILMWSMIIAQAHFKLTFTFFTWGMCCVFIADLFDQRNPHIGNAWAYSVVSVGLLATTPFWGSIWFGQTVFTPWIATFCLEFHPVFSGLKSLDYVTLQDSLLYQVTQSGSVEIRSIPWWGGSFFYLLICLLCLEITVRSPLHQHKL